MLVMDVRIDLDAAAAQIEERRQAWEREGIAVCDATWREVGEAWPPVLKTSRSDVTEADSVGVSLPKGEREGSVVLFQGDRADLLYWSGHAADQPVDEAPGWDDWLTLERFGDLLDRLGEFFK